MPLCSNIHCRKIANFYEEPKYECRIFFCKDHKSPQAKPLEDIELIDPDQPIPVIIQPREFLGCQHYEQVIVDREFRTVQCGKCGKNLDPIEVLYQFSIDLRQIEYRINAQADLQRKKREKDLRRHNRIVSKQAKSIGISVFKNPEKRIQPTTQ